VGGESISNWGLRGLLPGSDPSGVFPRRWSRSWHAPRRTLRQVLMAVDLVPGRMPAIAVSGLNQRKLAVAKNNLTKGSVSRIDLSIALHVIKCICGLGRRLPTQPSACSSLCLSVPLALWPYGVIRRRGFSRSGKPARSSVSRRQRVRTRNGKSSPDGKQCGRFRSRSR
jgi:hypothetical protein